MKMIDIRCDGGTDIGMGHVVRCVALAEMLKEHFDIQFVIQKTDATVTGYIVSAGFTALEIPRTKNADDESEYIHKYLRSGSMVVLDGYSFKTRYQQAIKSAGHFLIVIDDLHSWEHVADIVINHGGNVNPADYIKAPYTRLLLGYDYLLLRKEFYAAPRRNKISAIHSVTISMGAADINNLSLKFAKWLLELKEITRVNLLLSRINPHFGLIMEEVQNEKRVHTYTDLNASGVVQLLKETDLLICPASSISLEGCALGVLMITGTTALNQTNNCSSLVSAGAAISLGDLNHCPKSSLEEAIISLSGNIHHAQEQLNAQAKIIDGKSGDRILRALSNH